MKVHNISVDDLRLAAGLHAERKSLLGLLAKDNCGLDAVGPFFGDASLIAAVLPSYRNWLLGQVGTIAERLVSMGLSITDPDLPTDEVAEPTTFGAFDASEKRHEGWTDVGRDWLDAGAPSLMVRIADLERRFDTFVSVDSARQARG